MTSRLRAAIAAADEILAEVDALTIDQALERGEAPDHRAVTAACPWCGHHWHGLGCHRPALYTGAFFFTGEATDIDDAALYLTGMDESWPCRCESSLTRLDDTWRPALDQGDDVRVWADAWGLDGYAAAAEFGEQWRRALGLKGEAPLWELTMRWTGSRWEVAEDEAFGRVPITTGVAGLTWTYAGPP